MDSEHPDGAAVDQDRPDADAPVAAADGSLPAAPITADADADTDLADESPDADDAEADAGVYLTKAELADLESYRKRGEDIAQREAAFARKEAQSNRAQRYREAVSEARQRIAQCDAYGDEHGWDAQLRSIRDSWVRHPDVTEKQLLKEEIEERDALVAWLARPTVVTKLAKEFGITDKSDLAEMEAELNEDPSGLSARAFARSIARQNRKEAERVAKQRRSAATKRGQADKSQLDKISADRATRQADTLGGGNGSASFDLPFKLGSNEHIAARLPHIFGPQARSGKRS